MVFLCGQDILSIQLIIRRKGKILPALNLKRVCVLEIPSQWLTENHLTEAKNFWLDKAQFSIDIVDGPTNKYSFDQERVGCRCNQGLTQYPTNQLPDS